MFTAEWCSPSLRRQSLKGSLHVNVEQSMSAVWLAGLRFRHVLPRVSDHSLHPLWVQYSGGMGGLTVWALRYSVVGTSIMWSGGSETIPPACIDSALWVSAAASRLLYILTPHSSFICVPVSVGAAVWCHLGLFFPILFRLCHLIVPHSLLWRDVFSPFLIFCIKFTFPFIPLSLRFIMPTC